MKIVLQHEWLGYVRDLRRYPHEYWCTPHLREAKRFRTRAASRAYVRTHFSAWHRKRIHTRSVNGV